MELAMLAGCCSAGVIHDFNRFTKEVWIEDRLAALTKKAQEDGLSVVFATLSSNQILAKHGVMLEDEGWKKVHEFKSKPYGGGKVYLYAKNISQKNPLL